MQRPWVQYSVPPRRGRRRRTRKRRRRTKTRTRSRIRKEKEEESPHGVRVFSTLEGPEGGGGIHSSTMAKVKHVSAYPLMPPLPAPSSLPPTI